MTGALCAVATVLAAAAGCDCAMHKPHPLITWAARVCVLAILAALTAGAAWVGVRLCGDTLAYTTG